MKPRRVIGRKEPNFDRAGASGDLLVDTVDTSGELLSPFKDVIDSVEVSSTPQSMKDKDGEPDDVVCPICGELMVSLRQLNRHLDDEHGFGDSPTPIKTPIRESSPFITTPNEELRSWLKKTNEVKSKIQTALPRKFVKLDLFESANNGFSMSDSRSDSSSSINTLPAISVTRKHWQRPSGHNTCCHADCRKSLNIKNGLVNCRKCGRLYCNEHSDYRTKLNADAQYDSSGVWSRCCEQCYQQKPGYNDFGSYEELTFAFKLRRQKKIDDRDLYQNKLEKRVINLTAMMNKIDREYHSTDFNSNFLNFRINSKKREVEQQLVNWEDGSHVLNCFICMKNFTFTLRRHHCRLCGRVVCADLQSQCSMEVPIDHLTTLLDVPKVNDSSLIRMCRNCKDILFLKRNFQRDLKSPLTPLLQKFETQQNVKRAILLLMPRFHDMLKRLQCDLNTSKSLTQEASKLRKRLVDSFALFDRLMKEIVALDGLTYDEAMLQASIRTESANFIQINMAPLKQLPELLSKLEEDNKKNAPKHKYTREQVILIKQNREELMVLQEQKFLVEEMVENCKKQRHFDELPTLQMNLDELNKQIDLLQGELGDEGF
jgi:uncharacterized C2H2 Zn-finger protein